MAGTSVADLALGPDDLFMEALPFAFYGPYCIEIHLLLLDERVEWTVSSSFMHQQFLQALICQDFGPCGLESWLLRDPFPVADPGPVPFLLDGCDMAA